ALKAWPAATVTAPVAGAGTGVGVAVCSGFILLVLGCGGGSSSSTQNTSTPTPVPAPATGAVTVAAGQALSAVDINVSAPVTSPAINAELLGVTDVNSGGTATNTGATIHRGSTMKVFLF